jgi:ATP-dependent Clp protease ATP-binding subunit ClpC
MADSPFSGGSAGACDLCGQRPGRIRVHLRNGDEQTQATLCERCARQAMQAGGLPPVGALAGARPGVSPSAEERDGSATPALDEFGRDLTAEAAEGRIDPVIGRDAEIEQTVEILSRRRKNNAVLIGEAGVGKTAIAEGLARRIHEDDVPESLRGHRVVALDLAGALAGSQFRGQFEQRLKGVLEEAARPEAKVILFIDELHTVLGAGAAEGAMDAANMLKPLLARGELRVIGATTLAEYRRIERDAALARRFSAVTVDEPSVEETVAILGGLRSSYEEHHDLEIAEEALVAAARLSDRYVSEYHLPDKAIDLVDQAAARVRLRGGAGRSELATARAELERVRADKDAAVRDEKYERAGELKEREAELDRRVRELEEAAREDAPSPASEGSAGDDAVVRESDVAEVVAARTGIPVGELVESESERLQQLEADLHERVIGQDAAVEVVADTIRRARVGLSEGDKPLGTFLFLGPTGVGKTELVKALAERLFATDKALVRVDMSEYREPHTVARLIGSPPGYVGYGDGGQLTEPVRRRPYSVVLLDEVEKAHPEVWNVLLQVMDDGRLTDGEGRTVDFTNTVLVMTSNLGSGKARRAVGFAADAAEPAAERMVAAAKGAFLPEFLNRIDEIVTFHALTPEQVERIARLMVDRVAERLRLERGIELEVDDALVGRLARDGFDEEFGARPLQRHVRRTLEKELTRGILDGRLGEGAGVRAREGEDGAIELEVTAPAPLPRPELVAS